MGPTTLEYARGIEQTLSVLEISLNSTSPTRYTAADNFDGMINLAAEVAGKKVGGR